MSDDNRTAEEIEKDASVLYSQSMRMFEKAKRLREQRSKEFNERVQNLAEQEERKNLLLG